MCALNSERHKRDRKININTANGRLGLWRKQILFEDRYIFIFREALNWYQWFGICLRHEFLPCSMLFLLLNNNCVFHRFRLKIEKQCTYCVFVCGWCDRLLSVIFHICLVLFYLLCTSLAVPSSRSIESTKQTNEQTNAKAHVRERACTQFCCLEPNISYRDVNVYWLCRVKRTTDDCNCAVHYF